MTQAINIWLLTNAPSPYQVELFAEAMSIDGVTLNVRYMHGEEAKERHEGIHIMRGVGPNSWRDEFRLHPTALRECATGRFDCYVLSGLWPSITFLSCAALLWLRRKPWVVWLERPRDDTRRWKDAPRAFRLVLWARDRIRGFLLSGSCAILCMGTAARSAYAALGAAEEKLLTVPYCCDTKRYQEITQDRVAAVRDRYGLNGKVVVLFSGQMIERKGVNTLVDAFSKIAQQRSDVALLLLGEGPQKTNYQKLVPEDLRSRVHFAGLVSQIELPEHFAAAQLFVFPSRHDGWAVVINEACAAGLPIVTTRQTGAAYDLVEEGGSGFILNCEDTDGFVDRMLRLIDNPALRRAFGERSRELVAPFSAERGARLLVNSLCQVLDRPAVPTYSANAT